MRGPYLSWELSSLEKELAICAKALWAPESPETTPNPRFSRKLGVARNPQGIPTEFILSAIQNPTEFHWIFLKFLECPRFCRNFAESQEIRGGEEFTQSASRAQWSLMGPNWRHLIFSRLTCWPPPLNLQLFSGKKKSTNLNFGVRMSYGGVRVFHVNGARKFGMSFEAQGNQTFLRDTRSIFGPQVLLPAKVDVPHFLEKVPKLAHVSHLNVLDYTPLSNLQEFNQC